jgi:hypothetical protein
MSSETLSQLLPQKRELPFATSQTKNAEMNAGLAHVIHTTGTSELSMPSFPPATEETAASKPSTARKAPRKPNIKPKEGATRGKKDSSPTKKNPVQPPTKRSQKEKTIGTTSKKATVKQRLAAMETSMSNAATSQPELEVPNVPTPKESTVRFKKLLEACQYSIISDPGALNPGPTVSSEVEWNDLMNLPAEKRRAFLRELVIDLPNNENFKKLCDDIEVIWEDVGQNPFELC